MRKAVLPVLLLVFLGGCVSQQGTNANLDAFAQCLTENGVRVYSSYTCSACASQKSLFGPSFQYVNEVECNPRGLDSQYTLCVQKDIEATPTWAVEADGVETARIVGVQTLDELSAFGGCPLG